MTSVNAELYHREFDRTQERHEWDEDSICIRCGIDGAEWWHLQRTRDPESREQMPACEGHP